MAPVSADYQTSQRPDFSGGLFSGITVGTVGLFIADHSFVFLHYNELV
jgi:hypothetical protein